MTQRYVVTGAGPVGWTVAEQLAAQGESVKILTRSGSGPEHPLIDRLQVDVSDPRQLAGQFDGAAAVFHCTHGSAYSAKTWQAELPQTERLVMDVAREAGAVVVFPESLYSYSRPEDIMTEDGPRTAATGKRGVRTRLLAVRQESATPTVSIVASDFFGPRVKQAHAGERMVPLVLSGKTVRVIASADQPHSFTYVPDLADAMIAAARNPDLWNTVLHAPTGPALTQRELASAFAAAAGLPEPKVGVLPGWLLRTIGLMSADTREVAEMLYQFDAPFVMDSTLGQDRLQLKPTPLAQAAKETVSWWRQTAVKVAT